MASRKRKEAEKSTVGSTSSAPAEIAGGKGGGGGQLLLAGYLAHEFLTRGTLMGRRWDAPAKAVAEPPPARKPPFVKREADGADRAKPAGVGSYAEVARLVKAEEALIPGVVNPSQLARWVQM